MELILKAWTESRPFGWQGRHFQYRTISIWPRPLQQPHPPTYALGTSRESCEFAAQHHLGGGVSYGPFEVMARATRYYREQCARHGWQPAPEQIIYRANMMVADTDEEAQARLRGQPDTAPFAMRAGVRGALLAIERRNIAGEARAPNVGAALPTTFVGSPDTIVEQVRRCREVVGAGVLDLSLQRRPPGGLCRSDRRLPGARRSLRHQPRGDGDPSVAPRSRSRARLLPSSALCGKSRR
jgi:alkanesulfonate monooxygenase SsuD/methylene tetrahydromethanopterin reductase-like flavin-dependent oxidoreductase (luciferase family)